MGKKPKATTSGIVYPRNFIGKYGKHEVAIDHVQISGVKDIDVSLKIHILDFCKKNDKIDFEFILGDYKINFSITKHG